MSIKVKPDRYPEIIEVYNAEGKKAAYEFIRCSRNIKNPASLINRIKKTAGIAYDRAADRFGTADNREDDIFMNLDELCGKKAEIVRKTDARAVTNERAKAMENMVHALISDRLLEISKYVLLDPVNRRILIDRSCMNADGYQVILR